MSEPKSTTHRQLATPIVEVYEPTIWRHIFLVRFLALSSKLLSTSKTLHYFALFLKMKSK